MWRKEMCGIWGKIRVSCGEIEGGSRINCLEWIVCKINCLLWLNESKVFWSLSNRIVKFEEVG